jgi:UDP-N-acetylmuramoyl-L-alanyl-D-glutamate--2,6-diaminopimelate ligase
MIKLIFLDFFTDKELNSLNLEKLSKITTNLQDADSETIVFYNLHDNEIAERKLKEKLSNITYGVLILNRIPVFLKGKQEIISLELNKFLSLQSKILNHLNPIDDKKYKLIGVTGTNGKTTVTNLSMQIFSDLNKKAIAIGTLGISLVDKVIPLSEQTTTPSYVELRKILYTYKNYDYIFIEVSSHSLDQNRFFDISFDLGCWTNFTQDHLDYHKSEINYFKAKASLSKSIDSSGKLILSRKNNELERLLVCEHINFEVCKDIKNYEIEIDNPFFKMTYNTCNLELVAAICSFFNLNLGEINLNSLKLPKGRFEIIKFGNSLIAIDYAHTPNALENLLKSCQEDYPKYELTIVFGCGGDRDKGKRIQMGEIAIKYASKVVVTTDNPRSEDPESIIDDIVKGLMESRYNRIADREQAIKYAIDNSNDKALIIIAGKGHEEYQDIKGVKIIFSDSNVVKKYIGIKND